MAGRKRLSSSSSASSDSSCFSDKKMKRQVSLATFEKWQRQFDEVDEELQTLTWLRCDKDHADRMLVSSLWCQVCRDYENRIVGRRNFSQAWITGSSNQRTSNVTDHAKSEQHETAMSLMKTAQAKASRQPVESYAPIAQMLLTISAEDSPKIRHKF